MSHCWYCLRTWCASPPSSGSRILCDTHLTVLQREDSEKSHLQSPASPPLPGNSSRQGPFGLSSGRAPNTELDTGDQGVGDSFSPPVLSSYAVERKIEPFYKGGKVQVPAQGGAEWWGRQGLHRVILAETLLSPAGPDWAASLLHLWYQSQHLGCGLRGRAAEPGAGEGGESQGKGLVWRAVCSHGALCANSHF